MECLTVGLEELYQNISYCVRRLIQDNDMDGVAKDSDSRDNTITIDFDDGNSFEVIVHQTHAAMKE